MSLVRTSRRIVRVTYERLLAPFGSRAAEKMLRDGLPPQLAPALRFLFSGKAPAAADDAALRIERMRDDIAARPDVYQFAYFDSALGPVRLAEQAQTTDSGLTSYRLAKFVSVPRRWGMFLHLCAEAFNTRVILEMGACVGISGAYLASIRTRPRLVTLEGSQPLAQIARTSIAAVSDNVDVVVGAFEQTLSDTLDGFAQTIDVAYVDGHHEEAATLHYVDRIAAHLSPTALIVLDDIYLYEDMWRAWQTLSTRSNVIVVNVGRFGLLVYGCGSGRYDLARYTGPWRVGGARARAMQYHAP